MKKFTLLALLILGNVTLSFGQFAEGFEGGIPSNWTVINNGDPNTWAGIDLTGSTGVTAHGGNKIVGIGYQANAHDDYLITPAITVTAGVNDQIYFFGRSRDPLFPEVIDVLLSTTGTAPANFTVTLQAGVAPPSGRNWYKYAYNLSAYIGQTVYIAFRSTTTDQFFFDIDDVVNQPIPACSEPTILTASGITNSGATISWTAPAIAPANGYDYYVSQTNTAPTATTTPTGSTAAGVTTATVTVPAGTTSYMWARSKCSASDLSIWSEGASFTSLCNVSTESYTEDFEAATVPALPACTSVINAGTGNNWATATPAASSGFTSKALRYVYNTTAAANSWFFTNGVTLTAGTPYTITYKYGNNSATYVEKLKVAYGTAATVAAMTTTLADHPNVTGGTPNNGSVAFTPATSGTYYFGFNAYSAVNQFLLYLDDIRIIATALNTDSFDTVNFNAYPNPVKDVLRFSSPETISEVTIFNLLGQQVGAKKINVNQIDMSNLTAGTYMVKITIDNKIKTIKVIKE